MKQMVLRWWWLSLSFVAACFSPQFADNQILCGPSDECPPGLSCMDGVCRSGNGGGTEFSLTIALGGNGLGTVTSSPAGIECGDACSKQFPAGTMVTLTATPQSESTFVGWSGPCSGTDSCTVTLDAATTVTATFALHNSLIVVLAGDGSGAVTSDPAGIDCGTACSHQYPPNTTVTLTASSAVGSSFAGWSGGGCSGTGSCAVTVGAANVVTAAFSKTLYALTVTRTGSGSGTVTSATAGIDCGSDCTEPYGYNDIVTLTATPDSNSVFAGWTGAGCTGLGACVVTVTTSTNVAAQFTARHTLTVMATGAGSGSVTSNPSGITCGVDCTEVYTEGQTVVLTPTAGQGSTFAGWSGCDSVSGNLCSVTMSTDKTVHPTFATATYSLTVTVSPSAGGDVVSTTDNNINCGPTCIAMYAFNATVSLTATARLGYVFSGWSGACAGSTACSVTMTANKTVTASFTTIPTFALTVMKSGTGSGKVTSMPSGIDCGSDCNQTYNNNAMVVLTAVPALGSTFDGWTGACTNTTGTCTVTMTQARSVTARFSTIPPNYAFVTSTKQTGNLGGLSGADAICQARADAASLAGKFRAFLSTSTVNAIDRFGTARGWIRTDGKPFVDKLNDITTSHVLYALHLDESAKDIGDDFHFTASNNNGTPTGAGWGSCNDWTVANFTDLAAMGSTQATSHEVIFSGAQYCGASLRLLCLAYDNEAVVNVPPVSARRAFTTDGTWTPGGGLSSADAKCQAEASAAGLTGTYLALLPTSTASAISRFATGAGSLPWARLDNTLLAPTAGALAASTTKFLEASPNGNAMNTQWWAAQPVWGGGVDTLSQVAAAADTCNDWTSSSSTMTSPVGDLGATGIHQLMGGFTRKACNDTQTHLTCLQQ
jgi:uncharacterized repeat protein (TIGR02543 family)